MIRLGILGCSHADEACWNLNDLVTAAKETKGVFKDLGPVELVGCVTCNSRPEKKIMEGAKLLSKWGADIIAFSPAVSGVDLDNNDLYNERILKELSKQLNSAIIFDCRNGTGS